MLWFIGSTFLIILTGHAVFILFNICVCSTGVINIFKNGIMENLSVKPKIFISFRDLKSRRSKQNNFRKHVFR